MSNPQRSHGLQPSRLLRPWDFPGKSTRVGCHCLLRPEWLQIAKSVIKDLGKVLERQKVSYTACGNENGYDNVGKLYQYLLKLNIHILMTQQFHTYILQKKLYIYMNQKTYARIFIAILFVLAPNWKTQMATKSDLIFFMV